MASRNEFDERYYRSASAHYPRSPVHTEHSHERRRPFERSPSPPRRTVISETTERERRAGPAYLDDDYGRRPGASAGELVLRKREREVETVQSPRSPAAPPLRGILRPTTDHDSGAVERVRREEYVRTTRSPSRDRSSSPSFGMDRHRHRFHDRRGEEIERERVQTHIVERSSSRSSSRSRSPPVIRGPRIEREVVTHYTDVDHGVVSARPPLPDVISRHVRMVDRGRSLSRERRDPRISEPDLLSPSFEEVRIVDDYYEDRRHQHQHTTTTARRAQSATPPAHHHHMSAADREEAEYITSRIESRGRPGEARHGATRDWTIVDVPPGTERIKMDGAGGAGVDITYPRYSGVRRTKFVPNRDHEEDDVIVQKTTTTDLNAPRFEKEREVHVEKVTDRRVVRPGGPIIPPPRRPDMWTEITKDLVCRQAIEGLGYEYEETDWHFYVMQYLKYEDVLELIEFTEEIRRRRNHSKWDRDIDEWEHRHRVRRPRWDDVERERERTVERKVYVDKPRYR